MIREKQVFQAQRELDEFLIDLESKYELTHAEATQVVGITAGMLASRACLEPVLKAMRKQRTKTKR